VARLGYVAHVGEAGVRLFGPVCSGVRVSKSQGTNKFKVAAERPQAACGDLSYILRELFNRGIREPFLRELGPERRVLGGMALAMGMPRVCCVRCWFFFCGSARHIGLRVFRAVGWAILFIAIKSFK
jgi:hypothetical protein